MIVLYKNETIELTYLVISIQIIPMFFFLLLYNSLVLLLLPHRRVIRFISCFLFHLSHLFIRRRILYLCFLPKKLSCLFRVRRICSFIITTLWLIYIFD